MEIMTIALALILLGCFIYMKVKSNMFAAKEHLRAPSFRKLIALVSMLSKTLQKYTVSMIATIKSWQIQKYIAMAVEGAKSIKLPVPSSLHTPSENDLFWSLKLKEQLDRKQKEIVQRSEALKQTAGSLQKIAALKCRFQKNGEYCSILKMWEKDLNEIFIEAERFAVKEKINA